MRSSVSHSLVPFAALAALLGMVLLAGCQPLAEHARAAYDTAGLRLERDGWDTLRTAPRFVRRTSLGGTRPVHPETTFVHVFDADYDTLYAGPAASAISLPDRRLASREPLLVEACGLLEGKRALCEQATVSASPKRVRAAESRITFPEGSGFQQGRYDVRFVVERRAFRDTTWQRLEEVATPSGYLLARVESAGGQGTVRVPMSGEQGAFDLARHAGYDNFQYHLRSSLKQPGADRREGKTPPGTVVAFEVRAGLNGAPPQPVNRVRKTVRRLTPAERARQVQLFAQGAAEAVARRLHEDRGEDDWEDEWNETRTRATVMNWRFDRLKGHYEMDLRIRWGEGENFFDEDDRYTLEGRLTVEEGSRQARFTGERGNDRVVRRWRRRVDGDELTLGRLDAPTESDSMDVEKERLRDLAERRTTRRARSQWPPPHH